jgi:hypothetical protein
MCNYHKLRGEEKIVEEWIGATIINPSSIEVRRENVHRWVQMCNCHILR